MSAIVDRQARFVVKNEVVARECVWLVPLMFVGLVHATGPSVQADDPKQTVTKGQPPAATQSVTTAKPEKMETGSGRITGQVVFDKDGRVAAKASVVLLPPPPKGRDVYIGLLPLRETTADSEGRFTFDSLSAGRYRVWANLGKQTSRKQSKKGVVIVLEAGGDSPKPVELRLAEGITVTARVSDKATGKLIPKATIHLGWSDLVGDFQGGDNGPVIVQPLTPERWLFEAWAEGYAKESRWMNLENAKDAETEFQLVPGGNLDGVVLDADGKPVEGVGLSVRSDEARGQIAYVKTDGQGLYRLDHLPLEIGLKIHVSKVDWLPQEVPVRLSDENQKLNVTVVPRPHGGTIIGVVQDSDGNPVANAVLRNEGRSSAEVRETKSDAEGRFKLDNLFQGMTGPEVLVRAPKFAPQRLKVEPGTADKPNEIAIEMEPGHRIVGRVTDETGRAIEGVTVYFANGNHAFSMGGKGTTDKEGQFEFDSLPADCPFAFQKSGFSSIENRKLSLDADDVVIVEMTPVGVILGNVTDRATGKPIRSFNVRITFSPKRGPNDPNNGLPSDWIKPGQAFQSDAGQFRLNNLVARMPLQVMIDARGYETAVQEYVLATRSDEAEEVAFELNAIDPAMLRNYTGQLLDAKGAPVAGAQLRLIVARDQKATQREQFPFNWQMIRTGQLEQQAQVLRLLEGKTDKEGRFTFSEVPREGEVELVWWGDKIASGRYDHLETFKEEVSVEITLPEPARITGRLDRKTFPQIGRIEVYCRDEAMERTSLELKPGQQDFEIRNVAPGVYDVSLMSPFERVAGPNEGAMTNRRLASVRITLDEGDVKQVDFGMDDP